MRSLAWLAALLGAALPCAAQMKAALPPMAPLTGEAPGLAAPAPLEAPSAPAPLPTLQGLEAPAAWDAQGLEASALEAAPETRSGRAKRARKGLSRQSIEQPGAGIEAVDEASLKRFTELFDGAVLKKHPELFARKLQKAAGSDFTFFRAYPQLFYQALKRSPAAPALAATKLVRVSGDFHADNVEVFPFKKGSTVQLNDFDDSGRAPLAVELARMVVGAALLEEGGMKSRLKAAEAAVEGFAASLKQGFEEWSASLSGEKAVAEAQAKDRGWPRRAGDPVAKGLAEHLLEAAGLGGGWKVYDSMGSGLSSIGLTRYLFISPAHRHVFELKQLRPAALEFFTGEPQAETDKERVARAYAELREVPQQVRTLSLEGKDWLLRRREAERADLDLSRPKSAARVLGGLAAQVQLARGVGAGELRSAMALVTPELVRSSLDETAGRRADLKRILKIK